MQKLFLICRSLLPKEYNVYIRNLLNDKRLGRHISNQERELYHGGKSNGENRF